MSTIEKIKALETEIDSTKQRIEELPEFLGLEKYNLESRIQSLNAEIDELKAGPQEGQMAKAVMVFYGDPVLGSSGIRADFGGRIIEKYQHLINNVSPSTYKKHFKGKSKTKPSKASRDNSLVIVDIARGSFGFILQESGSKPGLADSILSKTIEETNTFISTANAGSDVDLNAAISTFGPRGLSALKDFLGTLGSNKATFKISTPTSVVELNSVEISSVITRLGEVSVEQDIQVVPGFCAGLFLDSMRFEHIPTGQKAIKGKISKTADKEKLSKFLYESCEATFEVDRTTTKKTKKVVFTYTLLDLNED